MVQTVTRSSSGDGVAAAAQLLHDFNAEYDEPAPAPHELTARLAGLIGGDHVTVLFARERGANYAFVVTSEQDMRAQRLYEAAGFRRTQGEGGPVMLVYEREL